MYILSPLGAMQLVSFIAVAIGSLASCMLHAATCSWQLASFTVVAIRVLCTELSLYVYVSVCKVQFSRDITEDKPRGLPIF